MLRILIVVASVVFSAHAGSAQSVKLVASPATDYDPKVTYDEVYGYVKYTVKEPKLTRKESSYNPFEKLIEAAKDFLGDSETASLTIALEVYAGEQRLSREPLLVQQWNEKGVFFLQNSREEIRQLKQSRVIVDYLPVSIATNRLTVKIAAYVNADSVFDLKTLQKLTALERLIVKANPVELSEHSKAVFATTEDFLNSVFGRHQKGTSELSTEMAFIGQGAAGAAKRRNFELLGVAQTGGETYEVRLPVEIEFGTHPTRLNAKFEKGKFDVSTLKANVFNTTRVDGADAKSSTVLGALRTSSNAEVRTFLDEFLGKKGYSSDDIDLKCDALWQHLTGFFTKRDQAGYFYSFLISNQIRLRNSKNGGACVTPNIMSEIASYGLPVPVIPPAQTAQAEQKK